MRFTDALLNPNGRISRAGFWAGGLTLLATGSLATFSLLSLGEILARREDMPAGLSDAGLRPVLVALILAVPVTWMALCLIVKRWHDRGRSGWWTVVALVPVLGNLWALIECGFLSGHASGNKYGPAPLKGRAVSHWDGEEVPEDMA